MKVAILTSPNQWFVPYAQCLSKKIGHAPIYYDHRKINKSYDILFILSYHKLIESNFLKKNKHNIVVHASDLPAGKGWAPLFWQVLEGKDNIVFTMFEAGSGVDDGDVYMKQTLKLTGTELHDELRKKQAEFIIKMCEDFIENYDNYKEPVPQTGEESFYPKRTPKNSKLDVDKTIREQFNLLRVVNNEEYPAYFELEGRRYILHIKVDEEGGESF